SLLIFGGDNGDLASQDLGENHPGFSNRILYYQPSMSMWNYTDDPIVASPLNGDSKTWAPVTTGTLYWHGGIVLVSREIRPGIRKPQTLFGSYVTAYISELMNPIWLIRQRAESTLIYKQ